MRPPGHPPPRGAGGGVGRRARGGPDGGGTGGGEGGAGDGVERRAEGDPNGGRTGVDEDAAVAEAALVDPVAEVGRDRRERLGRRADGEPVERRVVGDARAARGRRELEGRVPLVAE